MFNASLASNARHKTGAIRMSKKAKPDNRSPAEQTDATANGPMNLRQYTEFAWKVAGSEVTGIITCVASIATFAALSYINLKQGKMDSAFAFGAASLMSFACIRCNWKLLKHKVEASRSSTLWTELNLQNPFKDGPA